MVCSFLPPCVLIKVTHFREKHLDVARSKILFIQTSFSALSSLCSELTIVLLERSDILKMYFTVSFSFDNLIFECEVSIKIGSCIEGQ